MVILKRTTKPRGIVRLYQRGRLLWERENLVVQSGLNALASLAGGVTAGEFVSVVGFGSGNTTPAMGDSALSATPTYYNSVVSATIGPSGGVAAGSVQFAYALSTTDYGANGLNIQELGFFGNTGGLAFPAAVSTTNPAWASSHAYAVGNLIVDSNNNIQRCITAGTSGGSPPTWATTLNTNTNDAAPLVWRLVALHTAPTPMISHLVVPSFPFNLSAGFSGTYTISM